jgi:hypothetical protein
MAIFKLEKGHGYSAYNQALIKRERSFIEDRQKLAMVVDPNEDPLHACDPHP